MHLEKKPQTQCVFVCTNVFFFFFFLRNRTRDGNIDSKESEIHLSPEVHWGRTDLVSVAQQHTLLFMFMIHGLQETRPADTLLSQVNQCSVQQTGQLHAQPVALLINGIKPRGRPAERTRTPFNWRTLVNITARGSTIPPELQSRGIQGGLFQRPTRLGKRESNLNEYIH